MDKTVNREVKEYARNEAFKHLLLKAAQSGQSVLENQLNLLNNCKQARQLKKHYRLQDLFIRYWPEFVKYCERREIPIRKAITDNVEKMI